MNKNDILNEISVIEDKFGIRLPNLYKQFLSEEIKDRDVYEIERENGDFVSFFNFKDLAERNETYDIQKVEPDLFLIGQDGDLGYFVFLKDNDNRIYSLDLGALGSLGMDEEAKDLYSFS